MRPLDPLSCPGQDRIQVTLKNEEEQLQPEWMEGVECQVSKKKLVLIRLREKDRGKSIQTDLFIRDLQEWNTVHTWTYGAYRAIQGPLN